MKLLGDARVCAQLIQSGEISCYQLVTEVLDNIGKLNPSTNAVIYLDEEGALDKAQKFDQRLALMTTEEREELPVFFGVPILLKDLGQNWAGHPSTSGSYLLNNQRAAENDCFVNQVLEAGFIIVGRTNVPEFGLKTVSDSPYYGPVTLSLEDLSINPGGSSGGAAAAVKSGMVPIATASDAGGSIRVPASDCGLIGLKPSRGRVPSGPAVYRSFHGLATNLALTQTLRDSWDFLLAVQSYQKEAPFFLDELKGEFDQLPDLSRPMRIAYSVTSSLGNKVDPEAVRAVEALAKALEALGHQVEAMTFDYDGRALMTHYYRIACVDVAGLSGRYRQLGQAIEDCRDQIDPLTWAAYVVGRDQRATDYAAITPFMDQLSARFNQFLTHQYDLYLTPAVASPAVPADQSLLAPDLKQALREIDQLSPADRWQQMEAGFDAIYSRTPFSQLANMGGQPSLSLPTHVTADDRPLGVQFTAAKGCEDLLFALAAQLDEQGLLIP